MEPMPWQDFVLGFQVATVALDDPMLDDLPKVEPGDATGEQLRRAHDRIKKDPFLRVVLAIQAHFGKDYHYQTSLTHRFWALLHLMRRGHLAAWITTNDEGTRQNFHPAVLLAAAEVKLTKNAHFPVNRFLTRVGDILEEESG